MPTQHSRWALIATISVCFVLAAVSLNTPSMRRISAQNPTDVQATVTALMGQIEQTAQAEMTMTAAGISFPLVSGPIPFVSSSDPKALNPALVWNPGTNGLGSYDLTLDPGWLTIISPKSGPTDSYPSAILRFRGNFEAQVKLKGPFSTRQTEQFAIAGLSVESLDTYIALAQRLEQGREIVLYGVGADGKEFTIGAVPSNNEIVYLKVLRRSALLTFSYSADGQTWEIFERDYVFPLSEVVEIHIFAGSTARNMSAEFTDFSVNIFSVEAAQTAPPGQRPTAATLASQVDITATIVTLGPGISVKLRRAPDSNSETLALLPGSAQLAVLGRTADGQWIQVRTTDDLTGWISAQFVKLSRNGQEIGVSEVPLAENQTGIVATVITLSPGAKLLLRRTPEGEQVALLPGGTQLAVLGRTADGQWLQVRTADNLIGWVNAQYVKLARNGQEIDVSEVPLAEGQ